MDNKITFYIPCFNAASTLERSIRSVLSQKYPAQNILVVDDGSTDGSGRIAAELGVKVIRHEKNSGLAAARNTALKNCTTPLIASIDSDVEIEHSWLEKIMAEFSEESIAGVGGRLIEKYTLTAVDRWRQVHLSQDKGTRKIYSMPYLVGAATVYRVSALRKAGGFDEKYRTNFEDYDMGVRLNKMGFRLVHEPKAVARHLKSDDLKSLLATYRNWSLPFHHIEKRLQNISGIQSQLGLHHIRNNRKLMGEDIRRRQFHLLYPSFLLLFTEILKDIEHFTVLNPSYRLLCSFALRIIVGELATNKNIPPRLVKRVFQDLSDNIKNLSPFQVIPKKIIDVRKELRRSHPELDPLNYTSMAATLEILQSAVRGRLVEIRKEVFSQTLASAKEICWETKNSPYEKNGRQKNGYRVLLANFPWKKRGRYGVRAGSRWPHLEPFNPNKQVLPDYIPFPFFLAYGMSILKKARGLNPWIIDAIAEGLTEENFEERVRGFSPEVMVVETSSPSSQNDLRIVRKIKKLFLRSVKVVFVGPHVTALKGEFLKKNHDVVDYIIIGEYEISLKKLVLCLARSENPVDAPGVMFWDRKKIVGNGKPAPLVDLNLLPSPERLTLPMYNYRDRFAGMPELSVQLMASRGCPFHCDFCCWPQTLYAERRYRYYDPVNVVREMKKVLDDFGFDAVYFDDDTFNIGKKRILKLCSEIKAKRINAPWAIMARGDTSDWETFKAMKEAGLYAVKFGVESGVQKLVDECGKGLDLEKVRKATRICRELGIKTHLTFSVGFPGETEETIGETIAFALEADPDSAQFSIVTPFPGTRLFDILEKKGFIETKDWTKYDGACNAVFKTENFTPWELEKALERARERFHEEKLKRGFRDTLYSFTKMIKQKPFNIGLFPAGLYARLFMEKFEIHSDSGLFIFDNDAEKIGKKVNGIRILSVEQIDGLNIDHLLILHPAFDDTIYEQVRYLEKRGVNIIRVFNKKENEKPFSKSENMLQ